MPSIAFVRREPARDRRLARLAATLAVLGAAACAPATTAGGAMDQPAQRPGPAAAAATAPSPDPREGLSAGLTDAGQAIWNLRLLSNTAPSEQFVGSTNSDLAFVGDYAIQGNYNGFQIWNISNPAAPSIASAYLCPASQSDVSVYRNLLFVSGEGLEGRLDCGTQGVDARVSAERLRGIRIFDISDIRNPRYVGNVQTCRGSHTHTLLVDPDDSQNVYIYVSGSYVVRPAEELAGCSDEPPAQNPNSSLFRIEVIRVPLARPQDAAIVTSPRIFEQLAAPPQHYSTPAEVEAARASGAFIADFNGAPYVLQDAEAMSLLEQAVQARGGTGVPTAADSLALRAALPAIVAQVLAEEQGRGPDQCHDITVYPALGLGGGACEGYGFLLDISNPIDPQRIDAVADPNFSYWHSATFNNSGSAVLFSDEWGGGAQAKCRAEDPKEWGADAIFSIEQREMRFRSYYKLSAIQTEQENCVAHNGSLIPIPGRDVMVQAWYQGGISVFDFTDPDQPYEIAFFDRGPISETRRASGGPWSSYWYNGVIVSSEIARGLDILELTPSALLTQNEIDAAKTVRLDQFNPQMQPRFVWPSSFALARAYLDQLERSAGLAPSRIAAVRDELASAERLEGSARGEALTRIASGLAEEAAGSSDAAKVDLLAAVARDLGAAVTRLAAAE